MASEAADGVARHYASGGPTPTCRRFFELVDDVEATIVTRPIVSAGAEPLMTDPILRSHS
ncbi:hypothetical protein DJ71_20390 [Halorubrum sp. E3]|nr:hypothetical protein DJ71_20390 [Halorubrum sp. E3]